MSDSDDKIRKTIENLRAWSERMYEGKGKVFRILAVIVGFTVVLAGLAMTVVPGPAIVVIPFGFVILSLEFAWASRFVDLSIDAGTKVERLFKRAGPAEKVLIAAAIVSAAAGGLAWFLLR